MLPKSLRANGRLLSGLIPLMVLAALIIVGLSACASGGSNDKNAGRTTVTPGSVTYSNAARGAVISLVSESMLMEMEIPGDTHDERTLAFYSSTDRGGASTKVCRDDIIKGLEELFEQNDFKKYALEGPADLEDLGNDGILELKRDGAAWHLVNSDDPNTDPKAKDTFAQLLNMFTVVYNEVPQYQSVDGAVEFKKPVISDRLRRETGSGNLMPGGIR